MRRALLGSVAALVACVSLSACGGGGIKVTTVFDDVGDLQPRHSVQVADVRVGQVSSIKLTKDYKARVTMRVSSNVHIPERSRAVLRTTSLLGEKFVEIRPIGSPTKGPFLHDGSVLEGSVTAPELEFVAEELVQVLGAVNASDIATLAETGAQAFDGRGEDLRKLLDDLSTISSTFASRSGAITKVIDNLDATAGTLAAGKDDVDGLLGNLATTSQILADNRQRTIDVIAQLSRLAAVQNSVLGRYRSDIERQIVQADGIVAEVAGQTAELRLLIDHLHGFTTGIPKVIPVSTTDPAVADNRFTQVYMWLVPATPAGAPTCQDPPACS
jgi:phospholipid/cholesterol/gamma-HCH transport system substrate-binding protein